MGKRLSVTLDADDVRTIEQFADSGSREHESLLAWAAGRGIDPEGLTSEAALLRLLLRAGAESLRAGALDVAYARLAVSLGDEASADSRAARARYVKRSESTRAQ